MIKITETIKVTRTEDIIVFADKIVYSQKPYWCNCDYRQLSLSLIHPRMYYPYDPRRKYPLLVFVCGGGFQKMNRNVWVPELVSYAKKGYIVASVDYSVLPYTKFPEFVIDVKAAIRFLRANADHYGIDADHIAIMGESAGAYISLFVGATSDSCEYDIGEYLGTSSAVQAVVAYYPVVNMQECVANKNIADIYVDIHDYPDIMSVVSATCPPTYLLHGLADQQVPSEQSIRLYEQLRHKNAPCKLTLVEGASHADSMFIQPPIKERILNFLNDALTH